MFYFEKLKLNDFCYTKLTQPFLVSLDENIYFIILLINKSLYLLVMYNKTIILDLRQKDEYTLVKSIFLFCKKKKLLQ